MAVFLACCVGKKKTGPDEAKLRDRADQLAQQFIITDGHVDLPERLHNNHFRPTADFMRTIVSTNQGDFDFERASQGGVDAPFMAIFVDSSFQRKSDYGKSLADSLIAMVRSIAAALPDKFALAQTPADVRTNTASGKISLPMGMENGAPFGKDLRNVGYFFDQGIRYATLTHSKDNQICDSSYDTASTWNGLSPYGKEVVKEMNRVGMMVDISHVTDSTFFQVVNMTRVPVIASHSSCRYFTPGWQRNMSDEMILALGKNGGVINISFGANFLDSIANGNKLLRSQVEKALVAKGLNSRDSAAQPIIRQFVDDPVKLYSTVERVADHIDHVVQLIGVDHVGFGSDFDGVDDSLPAGLKDPSMYPNLIFILLQRGYSESDVEKICGGNMLRVWQQVLDAATGHSVQP